MNKRRADPLTWSVVSGDVTATSADESDGELCVVIALLAFATLCFHIGQSLRAVHGVSLHVSTV
jgi:hypothetical protein